MLGSDPKPGDLLVLTVGDRMLDQLGNRPNMIRNTGCDRWCHARVSCTRTRLKWAAYKLTAAAWFSTRLL